MTNVLCIEDNEDDVFLLKECLQQERTGSAFFSIHVVNSITAAEQYLHQHEPDIILLDLFLTDSDGLISFTRLYTQFAHIPIVILTSLDDEKLATEAVGQGAQDYLVKGSINPWLMGRIIRYALERHRIKMELNEANSKLEKLALNDSLTGLLNRRGLDQILMTDIQRLNRSGETSCVVLIDMDNFKKINDQHGHAVGDVLLKEVARRLRRSLRANDHAARVGGDEFLAVFPATRLAEAFRIAEKIRVSIGSYSLPTPRGDKLNATASLGVVALPSGQCTIDQLLTLTHDALYRSKKAGKNKVSGDSGHDGESRAHAEDSFLDAFQRDFDSGLFYAVKQPIVALDNMEKMGYEFYIRSHSSDWTSAEDFFRQCQENRVLEDVDGICFGVCLRAASLVKEPVSAHLNLFPSTLIHPSFLEKLPPVEKNRHKIFVEVSEEQIVGDPAYLTEAVKILKKKGYSFCLDNIRFGRSGLESLIALEPDMIKIDQSAVQGIAKNKGLARMLQRLLKIAQALKIEVIVLGVVNKDDLAALQKIGVRLGQGTELGVPA